MIMAASSTAGTNNGNLEENDGRDRAASFGRVHFDERQMTADHSGEIPINLSPDKNHADAHLGFVQEKHKYDVRLVIPFYLGETLQLEHMNPNVSVLAVKADTGKTKHAINVRLITSHHGLLNEELRFIRPDGTPFKLTILARALGKGKGTPMLKSGVHCVGVCDDYESDASSVADGLGVDHRKHSAHHKD